MEKKTQDWSAHFHLLEIVWTSRAWFLFSCERTFMQSAHESTFFFLYVVDVVNTASETQDVHEADAKNNIMNHTGLRHTSTTVQLHMETKLENYEQASTPLSIFLTHFPLAFYPDPNPTGA